MERRVGTRLPSSTRTMAWLHCQTPAGSKAHLTPWSEFLMGWACRLTLGRQSAWYAAPARWQGISWMRHTGDG